MSRIISLKRWVSSMFANTIRKVASRTLLGNEFQALEPEKRNNFCVMDWMERRSPHENRIAVAHLHTDDTNQWGSQVRYHARPRTSTYTICIVFGSIRMKVKIPHERQSRLQSPCSSQQPCCCTLRSLKSLQNSMRAASVQTVAVVDSAKDESYHECT
jgi:hypothetical protein